MNSKTDTASRAAVISRRAFVVGGSLALAGCQMASGGTPSPELAKNAATDPYYLAMYGPMPNERFPIPAVDLSKIDVKYLRQEVDYKTDNIVGTIIVDTSGPFLYFVRPAGKAIRYGIGVGRAGFSWSGTAKILMKREWPTWTPPAEMIARQPELEKYRKGQAPGLDNPLGARALYLFEGGRDTLYRLHGTDQPWSIGKYVSSGCIRLLNQDIIDLYLRTALGTKVIVIEQDQSLIG